MSSLSDSLVSFWEMEEASGTRVDSHGSNDLTDNNTVGRVAGKINDCANFESSNEEYLSRADNADLSVGNINFTIATWVRLESKPNSGIVGKWRFTGSNQREYLLRYGSAADRFQFIVSSNGVASTTVSADELASPSTATWYYLVAWHDAESNEISIQVNNGEPDTVSYSSGVFDGSAMFNIGAYNNGAAGTNFDGLIDQVGFWKRVLDSDERTRLYNHGDGLSYLAMFNPQPEMLGMGMGVFTPSIGLYDTRIKLRAKARDTFLTTRVRNS